MRVAFVVVGSLLLAGCMNPSPPTASRESFDPRVYDARGNVLPPVAIVPQPAPECREFERTVEIGGKPQKAYGTACRQPDGSWRFTN